MDNIKTKSYQSIFKATTIFGGVQAYQIIINIIRTKAIAVILGPNGMGVYGLFTTVLASIQNLTSMGLASSAVRDISDANGSCDEIEVAKTLTVLRKLVLFTGLLGAVIVVVFSPLLSKMSFGNYDYTIPFVLLSITLLIDQICSGQKVLLQGLRKLKYLAKASVLGSTFGMIISIPMYFYLGIKGVIPTIILVSLCNLLLSYYFARKIKIKKIIVDRHECVAKGRRMLSLGIAMSFSAILANLSSCLIRCMIRSDGGLDEVGYFQAGYAIINTYVGMVFTAIGTDFFPRLSAVNFNNKKCCDCVNEQGEIATLILSPIIIFCIIFTPIIISILYSSQFLRAYDFVLWASVGIHFKVVSWLISYIIIAKGNSKLFVWSEFVYNIYAFVLTVAFYKIYGLKGVGIAFSISYLLYLMQMYFLSKSKYEFSMNRAYFRIILLQFFLSLCAMITIASLESSSKFFIGLLLLIISLCSSIVELNRRTRFVDKFKRLRYGK
jgi:O-antigen/teichoic acid export membrane protein